MTGGTVADGFEPVRDAFASVLAAEPDLSAQLAVRVDGRLVVDLWAGAGLDGDSLLALYSSGKGAAFGVAALLVQDGVLDLDRPVAAYWPEFAAAGKAAVTVRELFAHQAGLIGVPGGFTTAELADDRALAARLAGQEPWWRPGSGYGYHAFVIGALVGELVLRVTGETLQEAYERRIRAPYGLDFHLGLPADREPRFLSALPAPGRSGGPAPESLTGVAFNLNATPPTDLVAFGNTRAVRAAGPASSGSVGNARGLAGMYAAVLGGPETGPALLGPEVLAEFTRPHTSGRDLVTGEPDHFLLGFEAMAVRYPELGPRAFGHSGAVGAQSFVDPDLGFAYAYTRRRFSAGGGGGAVENARLVRAVVASVTAVRAAGLRVGRRLRGRGRGWELASRT